MEGTPPWDLLPAGPALALELTARAASRLESRLAQFLKPFSLSPMQFRVLRVLRTADHPGCNCTRLADQLHHRDPDVTRLLDRLEKRGWIVRDRCSEDRRVVFVRLSAAGESLLDRIDGPLEAWLETLFFPMTAAQLSALCGMLRFVCGENRSDIQP